MKNRLSDLKTQTLRLFSALEAGNTAIDVRDMISRISDALQPLGARETVELESAETALVAGFPQLALLAAARAVSARQQATPRDYSTALPANVIQADNARRHARAAQRAGRRRARYTAARADGANMNEMR